MFQKTVEATQKFISEYKKVPDEKAHRFIEKCHSHPDYKELAKCVDSLTLEDFSINENDVKG